jgi:hypothetical protein
VVVGLVMAAANNGVYVELSFRWSGAGVVFGVRCCTFVEPAAPLYWTWWIMG